MKEEVRSKQDRLRQVPLFASLSKKHLDEIGKIFDEIDVKTGEVLAKQGAKGRELVFILEGEAKVERDGIVINRLSANNFFGEIALLDGKERLATVTAETDMRLLIMHSRFFDKLLEDSPDLQVEIIFALCRYLAGIKQSEHSHKEMILALCKLLREVKPSPLASNG